MPPIRILHISDLHLAEQPEHHSLLDQHDSVVRAVKKFLLAGIKKAVLTGSPKNVREAFADLLGDDSIAALINAAKQAEREKINETIDDVLGRLVLGNGSFKTLAVETLKNWTLASSYNSGALDCLCQFIEEQDGNLNGIVLPEQLTGRNGQTGTRRLFSGPYTFRRFLCTRAREPHLGQSTASQRI